MDASPASAHSGQPRRQKSRRKHKRSRRKRSRRRGDRSDASGTESDPSMTPLLHSASSLTSATEDEETDVEAALPTQMSHAEFDSTGRSVIVCQCGRFKCRPLTAVALALALVVVLAGVAVGTVFVVKAATHKTPPPPPATSIRPINVVPSSPEICSAPSANPFYFWKGLVDGADWFAPIDVRHNESFRTSSPSGDNVTVTVDWADHYAIQLFGNPEYLKFYDDKIREWNPNASTYAGTIDSCGWPDDPQGQPAWNKRTECFYEDFSKGWDDSRVKIALVKSCCQKDPFRFPAPNNTWYPADPNGPNPPLPYEGAVAMDSDTVEYPAGVFRKKNVIKLIALNRDNMSPAICGLCTPGEPCASCHKEVAFSGAIQTADNFASGKYEVIAKVPATAGLVWAMWTFHYEAHMPWPDCSKFGCYRAHYRGEEPNFPPAEKRVWPKCCDGIDGCCQLPIDRPMQCPAVSNCSCCDVLTKAGPCVNPSLCDKYWLAPQKQCAAQHNIPDPQFTGNTSIGSWHSLVNHEIDIEIPANCEGTAVCTETALPNTTFEQRQQEKPGCINRLNTMNMNNYIFTTPGGTGPAYANMCVKATDEKTEAPFQLIGDGKYHKYTIDWHTGGTKCDGSSSPEPGRVDFYVDDVYMGTNNVFVPTRAGRLTLSHWAPTSNGHYSWNNWPDNWGGGFPNDRKWYTSNTYISEIKITPHNEPNDIIYPASYDRPTGCDKFYDYPDSCHKTFETTSLRPGPLSNPDPGVLGRPGCSIADDSQGT